MYCIILDRVQKCSAEIKPCYDPRYVVTAESLKNDYMDLKQRVFKLNGVDINLGQNCREKLAKARETFEDELGNFDLPPCKDVLVDATTDCDEDQLNKLALDWYNALRDNPLLHNSTWAATFKQPLDLTQDEKDQLKY